MLWRWPGPLWSAGHFRNQINFIDTHMVQPAFCQIEFHSRDDTSHVSVWITHFACGYLISGLVCARRKFPQSCSPVAAVWDGRKRSLPHFIKVQRRDAALFYGRVTCTWNQLEWLNWKRLMVISVFCAVGYFTLIIQGSVVGWNRNTLQYSDHLGGKLSTSRAY